MAFSPTSPWRDLGDTTLDTFKAEFTRKGSPILAEAEAVYNAVVPGYSLLYLAQCGMESEYATTGEGAKAADHNPLGNETPDGTFRSFPSWAANAAWWKAHITDASGPYAATTTLAEYIHVYAPYSDGNDEAAYVQFILDDRARFPDAASPPIQPVPTPTATTTAPPTPAPTPLGRVPKPPVMIPSGGHVHGAYGVNREADQQRAGRIVGTVTHTSDGTFLGNVACFVDQQDTWGGLTDYQVGGGGDGLYDGVIMEFIDPSDVLVPYANGTWEAGPEAPTAQAVSFVDRFGVDAINARLRSIEHPDNADDTFPVSPRQLDSSAFLVAWVHAEQAGQTAETFAWFFGHRDFGVQHTDCPGPRFWTIWDGYEARIKEIMAAYQEGTPLSAPLLVTYPPGWTGGTIPPPATAPSPTPAPAPTTTPAPAAYAPKVPLPHPGQNQVIGTTEYVAFWQGTLTVTAASCPQLQWADPTADAVGPPLPKGATVDARGSNLCAGADGNLWVVLADGTRLPIGAVI